MTNVEKLISISSEALGPQTTFCPKILMEYALGSELYQILYLRNGFYAFESALHVFPLTSDPDEGLEGWNAESTWRSAYGDLAEGLLFFAEDALQDQFCLSKKQTGVSRFDAETGRTAPLADTIESWANLILSNHRTETGWPLAREWQQKNGPLPTGKRLMPKTPFFLGGRYDVDNLWAGNPLEGMRFKGDLATQTRDLPEGAQARLKIVGRTDQSS